MADVKQELPVTYATPKSRCPCYVDDDFAAHVDCPEHGVNRPGQGKCEPLPLYSYEWRKAQERIRELGVENGRLRAKCALQRRELRRLNAKARFVNATQGHLECNVMLEEANKLADALRARIVELEAELATLHAKGSPESAWYRCASFFMSEAGERWLQHSQCNRMPPPYQFPEK